MLNPVRVRTRVIELLILIGIILFVAVVFAVLHWWAALLGWGVLVSLATAFALILRGIKP